MSFNNSHSLEDTERQASGALTSYLLSHSSDERAIISSLVKPVTDLFTNGRFNESELEETVLSLWNVVIDKAESISWNDAAQDRLVNLLKEIKCLPPPTQPTPQVWGSSLWSDLPTFGASMRVKDTQWPNINAFAARLTAAQVADFSIYALWAMRSALETPVGNIKEDELNGTLQAASVWLQLYGRQMHDSRQIWEKSQQQGNMAGGGPLYQGPSGFCHERWQLWRERVDVLSREAQVKGKTKQMLRDASSSIAPL